MKQTKFEKNLVRALQVNENLEVIDHCMCFLADDVKSERDEIKRINKEEAMPAKPGDVWVQVLLRMPKKIKKSL